jgi:predicted AlkP superfamily pyrophosphatase or phosphodiesterase
MNRKFILIIIDGCRPDGIAQAHTPHIDSLWQAGAYTWTAQSVVPSVSLPAHSSMFRSVPPQKHGIGADNIYRPSAAAFPSFVDVAKKVGKHTAMFYDWEELRDLSAPGSLNTSYCRFAVWGQDNSTHIAQTGAQYIAAEQPDLCVIYMGDTDIAGHMYGWMSPEYLAVIAQADRAIQLILKALDAAQLRDQYVLLVQADHGGHDKGHGSDIPEDINIPWILNGPGVKRNHALQSSVSICDTAATIAHVLGVNRPQVWDGQPIYEAFQ